MSVYFEAPRHAGSPVPTGGVKVRSYLMTFRVEPAPGAPSEFSVSVQTTTESAVYNPNHCQSVPDGGNGSSRSSGCQRLFAHLRSQAV